MKVDWWPSPEHLAIYPSFWRRRRKLAQVHVALVSPNLALEPNHPSSSQFCESEIISQLLINAGYIYIYIYIYVYIYIVLYIHIYIYILLIIIYIVYYIIYIIYYILYIIYYILYIILFILYWYIYSIITMTITMKTCDFVWFCGM